jgi:beta-hydroxylase
MYYKHGGLITAPFNLYFANHFKHDHDYLPYPKLDSAFRNHIHIKNHWKEIREEVLKIYKDGQMKKIENDLFFRKISDSKWKRFYIKWYGPALEEACEKLPKTVSILENIPEIKSAMISVLEPGSIITPHIGPYRGVLRYHLGLLTPTDSDNCWIKVDGIKYSWHDGEDVLFDDTYVHEVQNNTDELRIILFCDVQRCLDDSISNSVLDMSSQIARVTTRDNK